MPSLSAYLVFLGTALAILLVPGPAVLFVVTRSIEMGRAGRIASVAGITTATPAARARPREEAEEPMSRTRRRAYSQGFLVNLTNPKMIVFALLPPFVDPHAERPWLQTLVLGLSFTCLAFLSDSTYALAAGSVADRLRGTNTIARVQRWIGGSVLVGLGILSASWSPSR